MPLGFLFARPYQILGKTMPVDIIVGWEVSIRDCEYKNFTSLIRGNRAVTGRSEQQGITQFLTATGFYQSWLLFQTIYFKGLESR